MENPGNNGLKVEQTFFGDRKREKKENYTIQPHPIKFQSNDSSASDVSYESSISSNEDKNLDRIDYFRQQMSRFFINYPELLNNQIVGVESNDKNLWADITDNIMNQAKQAPISLEQIAKRIAYYRRKTEQIDIIDLLIREKDTILQELSTQNDILIQQTINTKQAEEVNRRSPDNNAENVYFSWKKKRQNEILTRSRKKSLRSYSSLNKNKPTTVISKNQKQNRSLKNRNESNVRGKFHILDTKNKRRNDRKATLKDTEALGELNKNPPSTHLKHILNFEPKTEIGKQLYEQIKQNNPNDQVSIKKGIINFLSNHREAMQKEILSKSTLSQKINKIYAEDSKELLLFYPIKKGSKETQIPLNTQTDEFLQTLKQITEGPIMKYWKILQQSKI